MGNAGGRKAQEYCFIAVLIQAPPAPGVNKKQEFTNTRSTVNNMTTKTATEIVAEITAHIRKSGSQYYSEWYAGIASDIEKRLFEDHNVQRENAWWIYSKANSEDEARQAESDLLELGCKGGGGGGDEDTVFVYAYKITSTTKE
jgi:hypothetical protein